MKQAIWSAFPVLISLIFIPFTLPAQAADGYTSPGNGKVPFDLHVPFDYHNYIGSGLSQKTFDYYDSRPKDPNNCNPTTETVTFKPLVVNGVPIEDGIEKTLIRSDAGKPCQYVGFFFQNLGDKRVLLGRKYYNPDGTPNGGYAEFKSGLTRLTSTMRVGDAWATASGVVIPNYPVAHVIEKGTLVGIEDVTVPAGEFKACLRIQLERWSLYVNSFNRIAWYCPGVGMVKHMTMNFSNPASAFTVRIKLRSYAAAP